MKLLKLTDDAKVIARVIRANSDNDGYCKYQIFKDKKSKCPFDINKYNMRQLPPLKS